MSTSLHSTSDDIAVNPIQGRRMTPVTRGYGAAS